MLACSIYLWNKNWNGCNFVSSYDVEHQLSWLHVHGVCFPVINVHYYFVNAAKHNWSLYYVILWLSYTLELFWYWYLPWYKQWKLWNAVPLFNNKYDWPLTLYIISISLHCFVLLLTHTCSLNFYLKKELYMPDLSSVKIHSNTLVYSNYYLIQ